MPSITLFYSRELSRFDFGPGHPFTGERFESFIELLDRAGVKGSCEFIAPVPATDEDLRLVHTDGYLAHVKHLEKIGGKLTMDTPVTGDALDVQALVTGSGLQAAELLLEGDLEAAHTFGGFHHAGRDYGEGFCLYNDVAIVTKALIERHGLDRILILDTDAHQGNGTMDVFYEDPRILFVSIHQDPRTLYPGRGFTNEIGQGEGKGYTVNLPLPPYAGNKEYEHVFAEVIAPLVREFDPQMMIRNGGSDPYFGDELTMLGLDLDGLYMMGRRVRELADSTSNKLLDMMVSGYGDMVIYGWLALFCGIEGLDVDFKAMSPPEPAKYLRFPEDALMQATENMVEEVRSELVEYWKCF